MTNHRFARWRNPSILATVLVALFGAAGVVHGAGAIQLHVPTVMIHRILCATPDTRLPGLYICPDKLDAQMAALQNNGWHSITADELATDMATGVCPGDKTFVITVDDGALDGYTNGAPIFEAHGFTATYAIVVGKVGFTEEQNPGKPHFSWDQARDLVARGFDIANHTMTHASVKNASTTKLDAQVQAAQDKINTELGFTPKVFVYPYGSFGTAETPYLAARFTLAFTTQAGANENPADPMHAPRIRDIGGTNTTTPAGLLKKLAPFAHPC